MRINRKLFYPALILAASLLILDLGLLARGRSGYSRGSTSRYSGSSANRGSMSSYFRLQQLQPRFQFQQLQPRFQFQQLQPRFQFQQLQPRFQFQ